MTASYQTSFFSSDDNNNGSRSRRTNRPLLNLYQCDVENFDNEVETFEVEAASYAEAAEIAECRASGDVYNMNIYEIQPLY